MRVTAAILAVVAALLLGRFVWDDIISGGDIPRGLTVDGVAIGNTDRANAAERLRSHVAAGREVELHWDGEVVADSLAHWGVIIDTDATIAAAENARGGGPIRFLRWAAAVVRDRTVDPVWAVDRAVLAEAVGRLPSDLAVVESLIQLDSSGDFVATALPSVPVVDLDALEGAVLAAAVDETITTINVPVGSFDDIEQADDLAAAANELTDSGVTVRLAGQFEEREIPSSTLRQWLVVSEADRPQDLTFAPELVTSTLRDLFPESEHNTENGVQFVIGFDGEVYIAGSLDGSVCCAVDTADNILAALRADADQPITVFPIEEPEAEGLAWAESLGITEVVGEFTTFYKPDQTRNINIARISEITRGAVIEPGETFSINDFVGRRTTADGFVAAGVISNGVFSSSVGGGISQYATTLFNAAFFAGLDFAEYQSHSIYIDRYPFGREATVSFPAPDLQIVNTTPYGILLWPTTNDDSITVRLYSTRWVSGEQTGQMQRPEGSSCTRVTTERTRTWIEDARTEIDTVTARYRPEGINCNGTSTRPTTTTTTTTTVPTSVP